MNKEINHLCQLSIQAITAHYPRPAMTTSLLMGLQMLNYGLIERLSMHAMILWCFLAITLSSDPYPSWLVGSGGQQWWPAAR